MDNPNEAGFTLIETLVTLCIVSLFMSLPVLSIKNMSERIQIDLFFRELSSNITLVQNHAMLTGEQMVIEFIPQDNIIRFKQDIGSSGLDHPLFREIHLQEGLYELHGNTYHQITFHGYTGHISSKRGWTTHLDTSQGVYKLIFWLGSGRFEIQKLAL